jgi:hypothetical protein
MSAAPLSAGAWQVAFTFLMIYCVDFFTFSPASSAFFLYGVGYLFGFISGFFYNLVDLFSSSFNGPFRFTGGNTDMDRIKTIIVSNLFEAWYLHFFVNFGI